MKRVLQNLSISGALLFAFGLLLSSCGPTGGASGHRTDPTKPETPTQDKFTMVLNPYWSVSYDGRGPIVERVTEGSGSFDFTYMVDKVTVKSTDSEKYYVATVSKKDFESSGKNFANFCSKDLEEVKALERQQNTSFLRSGNFTETFFLLDDGGGEFYAIIYGVDSDGKLSGSYAFTTFTTPHVTAQLTDNWTVDYNGRYAGTDENGFQFFYDEVSVSAKNNESYYVDIISNKYLNDNFGGDLMAYFQSVSDYLYGFVNEDGYFSDLCFGDNPSLLTGTWDVTFNRLYPGNYFAIAFGLDADGIPTGRYSVSDKIEIKEQEPTAQFSKWLGKWRVTSQKTVFDDGDRFEIADGNKSYDLEITNLDSNYEYEIKGWEQGKGADGDLDYNAHTIYASYDGLTGKFLISSQYITTMTYTDNGVETYYDDYLLGKFTYRQGLPTYLSILLSEGLGIAVGEFDEGDNASIKGLRVSNVDVDGDNMDVDIIAMQFYQVPQDTEDSGLYYFSETVPAFPLTLSRISGQKSAGLRTVGEERSESVASHLHRASQSRAHGGEAHFRTLSSRNVDIRSSASLPATKSSAAKAEKKGGKRISSDRTSYSGRTFPVR